MIRRHCDQWHVIWPKQPGIPVDEFLLATYLMPAMVHRAQRRDLDPLGSTPEENLVWSVAYTEMER